MCVSNWLVIESFFSSEFDTEIRPNGMELTSELKYSWKHIGCHKWKEKRRKSLLS